MSGGAPPRPIKTLSIKDLSKQTVKCEYCKKEVQISALPIHEYMCSKAKPMDQMMYNAKV